MSIFFVKADDAGHERGVYVSAANPDKAYASYLDVLNDKELSSEPRPTTGVHHS